MSANPDSSRSVESALPACPVCGGGCSLLDVVDFNKSCEEFRGRFLPLSGTPIYYGICSKCGFSHAPEMYEWSLEQFEARVYNADYVNVDPDYLEARPSANADFLIRFVGAAAARLRHLDYGGGHGLLSDMLRDAGWNSQSYDPFVDRALDVATLGTFSLITAFEVFEHVPDVQRLMAELGRLIGGEGVVLFSTLLGEGKMVPNSRITWWYASPRNGHVSIFTQVSLAMLSSRYGMQFGSLSPNLHALWRRVPDWAAHILPPGRQRQIVHA